MSATPKQETIDQLNTNPAAKAYAIAFLKQHHLSLNLTNYIHKDTNVKTSVKVFGNQLVSLLNETNDAWDTIQLAGEMKADEGFKLATYLGLSQKKVIKVAGERFLPGAKNILVDGLHNYVNVYKNPEYMHNIDIEDVEIMEEHSDLLETGLLTLLPDGNEIEQLLLWMAHVVLRPQTKTGVAILIHGSGGTGKGALARLLSKLIGEPNISTPKMNQFNLACDGHTLHKGLVIMDEVADTKGAGSINNRLKNLITEPFNMYREPSTPAINSPSYENFLMFSNSDYPITIDAGMVRRIQVYRRDLQQGEYTMVAGQKRATPSMTEKASSLYKLTSLSALRSVRKLLHNFLADHEQTNGLYEPYKTGAIDTLAKEALSKNTPVSDSHTNFTVRLHSFMEYLTRLSTEGNAGVFDIKSCMKADGFTEGDTRNLATIISAAKAVGFHDLCENGSSRKYIAIGKIRNGSLWFATDTVITQLGGSSSGHKSKAIQKALTQLDLTALYDSNEYNSPYHVASTSLSKLDQQ
jgi:hypothetical protein